MAGDKAGQAVAARKTFDDGPFIVANCCKNVGVRMAASTTIVMAAAGAGGAPLQGTLVLPARRVGPGPALLLVQGSGPTDRDGNQPPALTTDLLSQLAGILAGFGIASLRYDKRGMHANAASLPREPAALREFMRFEHVVDDAAAMLAALRKRPEIDPAQAGLFGHSEGGSIGLALATRRLAGNIHATNILPEVSHNLKAVAGATIRASPDRWRRPSRWRCKAGLAGLAGPRPDRLRPAGEAGAGCQGHVP